MKVDWFKGLPEEEAEQMKKNVLGSKILLDRLKEICYNNINSGEKVSLSDFDSPSWPYKQAFRAGRNSALRELIDILTVD